jgi:hypothetical protein
LRTSWLIVGMKPFTFSVTLPEPSPRCLPQKGATP